MRKRTKKKKPIEVHIMPDFTSRDNLQLTALASEFDALLSVGMSLDNSGPMRFTFSDENQAALFIQIVCDRLDFDTKMAPTE